MGSYDEQRAANIAKNKEILASLNLGAPMFATPVPAAAFLEESVSSKRPKTSQSGPKKKKVRKVLSTVDNDSSSAPTLRRSTRAAARGVSYREDDDRSFKNESPNKGKEEEDYEESDSDEEEEDADSSVRTPQRKAQRLGIRTQDPKQFGHIPGVEIGTWWESRMDCSTAAIHAPTVCGIAGSARDGGAFSIALSGGYEDDIDQGYVFTYTGAGGRDLKGTPQNRKNLRTAPQSKDQSFEHIYNKALEKSVETRKPVRVVRGFKLQSKYAPKEGYRYDGLYIVEKAWMETGLNPGGFKVCKFALCRLEGQPPIPINKDWKGDDEEEDAEDASGDAEEDPESEVEEKESVKKSTRKGKEGKEEAKKDEVEDDKENAVV